MKVLTLFFDLDGTLVEPRDGILGSLRYALERMQRPIPETEELLRFIGPSIWSSMGVILGTEDRVEIGRGVSFYRERYNEVGVQLLVHHAM